MIILEPQSGSVSNFLQFDNKKDIGPISNPILAKGGNRTMIPIELLEDYLIDQDDGIKKLLTWFLNLVMQLEAIQQADAEPYQRIDS